METYIFLSVKDKKALERLAEVKRLSISTTAGIIINHLYPLVNTWYPLEYIAKGERMIHIKIRNNTKMNINSIHATNCLYCYFNKPLIKGQKINWQNKGIQKELDKTEDPNRNKNMEIRIAYRLKKGLI